MPKIKKLKNGLRYIIIPTGGTKTATILVMIGTGSKHETKKNNGISHFLEHMFFKGTIKRPDTLAISSELDSVGAEFNAFTSKEYTGYWVKIDSSKLDKAIDIVGDMLINSKMETREIEKEKGVIIEEINMYHDNPMMYIEDLFEECLYGNQPAGWDTLGTKKNILQFKRKDFLNYLKSQYGVQNALIGIAGNVGNKNNELLIANLLNKCFSGLKNAGPVKKLPVVEAQIEPKIKIYYKKTDQTNLSLGVRAFSINHKDAHILKILSILLGGSMSARLFIELREKRGLAYYVRTQAEFYTDTGYLTTQAGVPVKKLNESIEVILSEYKKLTSKLVSEKELNRVKDLFKGRLAIFQEASDNVASWYGRDIILRNKVMSPKEFIKKIQKVKPQDIKRVANEIMVNEGLNLAVIGPYRELKFEVRF